MNENQEETITITKTKYDGLYKIRNYYFEHIKAYNKLELTKKQITSLRKKITQEKKESFSNILRIITTYQQDTNDELLKLYINKLYLQYFPQHS